MKQFTIKKEALRYLAENGLSCVGWTENGVLMCAIYWNGKRKIIPADKKIQWAGVSR